MTKDDQLNRIAGLLDIAYSTLTSPSGYCNLDVDVALGCLAEAKAVAENDLGSFDEGGE